MGEANSITDVRNSGLYLFNEYQKKNSKPFVEDITDDSLEGDNIKLLLNDHSNWTSTTSIPKYFDKELQNNSPLKINEITLNNYLSKFILLLKYKFPKHYS